MVAAETLHDLASDMDNVVELTTSVGYEDGDAKDAIDKHARQYDGDEALGAIAGCHGEDILMTPEVERKLLRKIDFNIMPMLCVVYALNFLDKTTLSYASIMGLQKDIGLHGTNYQWLSSMFYIGYIVWEYPTNRLLQRLPLAKWSSFNIIVWGLLLCCMAAVKDFTGAVAIRFLLGVFESAVTPAFVLFTSQWYTREEQGSRTGIWFSFNGVAQVVGGVVAYGISVRVKSHGASMAPWKIFFLATGLATTAVGFAFLYFMPDNQLNARFLNPQEKAMAVNRIRMNQQGVGNKHFKMYQLKEALLDPMTWAFFAWALLGNIPNGGITNYFSQLIVAIGYTADQSLLYGTPGGAVEVISLVVWGFLGDRFKNRILGGILGMLISIVGMLLIVCLPISNSKGRLAGYYLTQTSAAGFVAILSLISSNIAGYTKKTTVAALYLIGYCVGNIIGPQTFVPRDAPRYIPAEITIIICWSLCVFDFTFIYWYYRRLNKKNEAVRADAGHRRLEQQEFLDLTDRENHEFVYTL